MVLIATIQFSCLPQCNNLSYQGKKKKKIQKILDKQRKTILKKSIFHFNLPQHDFLWFGALPITKTVRDGLLLLIQGTAHW